MAKDKSLGRMRVDIGAPVQPFFADLDKAAAKLSRWSKRVGGDLTRMGKGLSRNLTTPLLAIGTASTIAADRVGKAQRDIAVATGAVGDDLAGLQSDFRELATEVPGSLGSIASAMGTLNTTTGAQGQMLKDLAGTTAEVATLLGTDLSQAALGLGRTMQQWQVPASAGAELAARMYQATQGNAVAFDKLTRAMTMYGPVLQNANFSTLEAVDFMARLEGSGLSVSRVMPGINAAMRRMAEGGLKDLRGGLQAASQAIVQAEDDTTALAIATEVFGAEGAQRMAVALRSGVLSLDDLGTSLTMTASEVRGFAEDNRTLGDRFSILGKQVALAATPLGEELLGALQDLMPWVRGGIRWLTELGQRFGALEPGTRRWVIGLVALAAALGPVLVAVGFMVSGISGLVWASRLAVIWTAKLAAGLWAVATPLLVIATAAASFDLGRRIYEQFRPVQEVMAALLRDVQHLWEWVKYGAGQAARWIERQALNTLRFILQHTSETVQEAAGWLAPVADALSPGGGAALRAVATLDTSDVDKALDELGKRADAAMERYAQASADIEATYAITMAEIARDFESRAPDAAGLAGLGQSYMDDLDKLKKWASDFAKGVADEVGSAVQGVGDDLADAADEAGRLDTTLGTDLPQSLQTAGNQAKVTMDDVRAAMGGAGDAAEKAFGERMLDAIEGWSREVSRTFADMLVEGEATFGDLADSFARMLTQMLFQELVMAPLFASIRTSLGFTASQHGNVFGRQGLQPMAHGGVVTQPTVFPAMGALVGETGADEAAFAPLRRIGPDLGVGAVPAQVHVQIIDQRGSGADIEVSEQQGPDGRKLVEVMVRDAVRGALRDGSLDRDLSSTFGLRRQGRRG